jgi:hypothetical protein
MPRIEFDVPDEAYAKLQAYAVGWERQSGPQAKVIVLEFLGIGRPPNSSQKLGAKAKAASSKLTRAPAHASNGVAGE